MIFNTMYGDMHYVVIFNIINHLMIYISDIMKNIKT